MAQQQQRPLLAVAGKRKVNPITRASRNEMRVATQDPVSCKERLVDLHGTWSKLYQGLHCTSRSAIGLLEPFGRSVARRQRCKFERVVSGPTRAAERWPHCLHVSFVNCTTSMHMLAACTYLAAANRLLALCTMCVSLSKQKGHSTD